MAVFGPNAGNANLHLTSILTMLIPRTGQTTTVAANFNSPILSKLTQVNPSGPRTTGPPRRLTWSKAPVRGGHGGWGRPALSRDRTGNGVPKPDETTYSRGKEGLNVLAK